MHWIETRQHTHSACCQQAAQQLRRNTGLCFLLGGPTTHTSTLKLLTNLPNNYPARSSPVQEPEPCQRPEAGAEDANPYCHNCTLQPSDQPQRQSKPQDILKKHSQSTTTNSTLQLSNIIAQSNNRALHWGAPAAAYTSPTIGDSWAIVKH